MNRLILYLKLSMESISYNSNKWNTNLLPNTLLAGLLLFFPLISNNTNYCYIKEIFVFSISAVFILYYLFFKNKILIYVYDIYIIIGIIYILSNTNNWDNDTYTTIHYIIIFFSVSKAKWDINILFTIISISTIHTIISIINNWSSPLMGIMNNSGITGIYLAITYPIGLFFLLKTQRIVYKIIYGSILTLITICILLTDSRSAILSITICTIYIYIKNSNSIMNHIRKNSTKKSSIYILLFISLCIVSLYNLINHRKESVDGRILIYKITTKMISDKPIFGFGYNTFYSVYPDYQASYFNKHPNSKYKLLADNTKYGFNEILQIGVENGITGIILIFIFTICLLTINNNEDKFIVFCRRCNRYDRCWACPPYDFDISARIGKYKYICITGTQIVPDPSSVPTIPAGTEKEVVIGLLTEVRLQLDSWLRWLETEYPGSLACYAGTCHLCPDDTCTRITGQPCRHPHLIRHSLESFGFDLGRTAEELLHIPLVWSDGVKFPEYLMLVSGLFTDVPIDISLKPAP